jgi:acid phosphatase (class A)
LRDAHAQSFDISIFAATSAMMGLRSRLRINISMTRLSALFSVLAPATALACLIVCVDPSFAQDMNSAREIRPGAVAGYLSTDGLPDSVALLPPPPPLGSVALALDLDIARTNLTLRDTPRWNQARMDANLKFPWAAGDFSCAVGVGITEQDTPRVYNMLRRVMADAGAATGAAKNKYQHARPFMVDVQPTCTPEDEAALRGSGSYPSGHTSIGWAWALVLAEASPAQSEAILIRGRTFGDSRLVCNVHWESDVIEGRMVGTATVARLRGEPSFLADLEAAKSELAAARAKGLAPQRDCKAEAEALAQTPLQAP